MIKAKHPQFINIDFKHLVEQLGMPVREVSEEELKIVFPFAYMDDEEDEDDDEDDSSDSEDNNA